jgi:hypothetical protein
MSVSPADLLARQTQAAAALVEAAQSNSAAQQTMGAQMLAALEAGDPDAAVEARNAMWDAVYRLHKQVYAFDAIWNEMTPRVGEVPS